MSETIKVNGRVYKAREIDFDFICDLDAFGGISMADLESKVLPAFRFYVASCMGVSTKVAARELQEHVIKEGNFEDVMKVFAEKIETSDFFQALTKQAKQEATSEKSSKKKEEESE